MIGILNGITTKVQHNVTLCFKNMLKDDYSSNIYIKSSKSNV